MNANELRKQAASLEQAAHHADDRQAMQDDMRRAAELRRQADKLDGKQVAPGAIYRPANKETKQEGVARAIREMNGFFSPEQHALREKKFKQMLAQK